MTQYALIGELRLLMDAGEWQALRTFCDAIADLPGPDQNTLPYHVCYGCYLPQADIREEEAMTDLAEARDHWMGIIERDKCHLIAFCDAEAFGPRYIGLSLRIPFAALVQADPAMIERIADKKTRRAVTAFLRYANLSPATNILNRPGVFALKGVERRIKDDPITPAGWRKHIDRDRAGRTPFVIK